MRKFDPDQLDDEMLEAYDEVQRRMIATGEAWQRVSIPPKIYEAVRKLYPESRPPFRTRCFDVQLIGGLVLYEGKIAEMATGEGKTFVAPLACFMKGAGGIPLPCRDGERLPRAARFQLGAAGVREAGFVGRLHPKRDGARRRGPDGTRISATSPMAPTPSSASIICATT